MNCAKSWSGQRNYVVLDRCTRGAKILEPIESWQFTLRAVFRSISLYDVRFCLESQSRLYKLMRRGSGWNGCDFIRAHMAVLAGTDFFTVEVLTLRGLVTFYVLFFIHLETRRVEVAGMTPHPNEAWMKQIARNVTMGPRRSALVHESFALKKILIPYH